MNKTCLFEGVQRYLGERTAEFAVISSQRRHELGEIVAFVQTAHATGDEARLVFICTHNSRRSHLCQIWAAVAASVFSIPDLVTFSGGTEATAFNPRAVSALERAGLHIAAGGEMSNPRYRVRYSSDAEAIVAFSKVFDQPPNPAADFCAVMNCSSADQACPVVAGATARVALRYDDPKESDGSDLETSIYDERCAQIAREMFYVASLLS